ncbi:MAG TPA: hypothetical protein VFV81_03215 [Verrucomicrobiae bacterium]|nr:hypothetical protein [Verrucomicrobiae bacterium]
MSLAAFAAAAIALAARAQGDAGTESIIFSSPQGGSGPGPTVAPSRSPATASPTLGSTPELFSQPSPRIVVPPPQNRPPQKSRDDWTLMTPAEILGVETPEKALKSAQQKAYDRDREGRTPMERFLKRQSEAEMGLTNAAGVNAALGWDFSRLNKEQDLDESQPWNSGYNSTRREDFLRSSLNEWTANPSRKGDNVNFSGVKRPPGPVSAQQANAMSQLQQLLQSAEKSDALRQKAEAKAFSAVAAEPDPNLQPQPRVNPAGQSFQPLESGITRPTGITPLPTATVSPVAPPVATPSWAPQPPPWVSQNPQPLSIPQRKF